MRKRRYFLAIAVSMVMWGLSGCAAVETLSDGMADWLELVAEGWNRILSKEDGEAGTKQGGEVQVLEGYQKLTKAVDKIMKEYEAEDGSVTEEEAAHAAEEIYQYGCTLEEKGKIKQCIRDEDADSVTMVLETGARIFFAPHIKDTYGGYSVDTVNAVDFGDTVPVSVVFNGGKTVHDYGEYTMEMMSECEDWSHLDDTEVSVRNVRDMLEDVSRDDCRLIYWRGHGNKSDGKSVFMLAETENAATSQEFSQDIEEGNLIVGDPNYWITPGFIEKYMSETEEGGLFFCGACFSAADGGQMARAFLDKGYQAYVGTSDTVMNIYSDNMMRAVAENLCQEDPASPGETMPILSALLKARKNEGETDVYTTRFLLYERVAEQEEGTSRMGISKPYMQRTDNLDAVILSALDQSREVEEFRLRYLEIDNNGGSVVRYQGNDYYWKYTVSSVAPDGLFAYFGFQSNPGNQMICRHPDGTEEVLFTADGNGDIYIAGGRMYLKAGDGTTFSVKLDGSERINYDYFTIWGADPASGLVLGTGSYNSGVQAISGGSGSPVSLTPGGQNYVYGGTVDDFVYFSAMDAGGRELRLYRYQLGGSGEVQEIDRHTIPEQFSGLSGSSFVTQVSHLGNTVYYSYGYYAGTGGFFQEGGINSVELDQNGTPVSRSVCAGSITAEEFLAERQDGTVRLYYNDEAIGSYIGFWDDYAYDGCKMKDLSTGQTSASSFRLSRPGSFICMDGAVCRMNENQASYTTLIPAGLVSGYGCIENITGEEAQVTLIRDLEVVDRDVYYTVETGIRDRNQDMGWRPGYQRSKSERYRLRLGGEQAELLFSY